MADDLEMTEAEKVDVLLKQEIGNAWASLIGTYPGRLVLHSILDRCGVNDFAFYGGEMDALMRGRQQIGGEILEEFVYPNGMENYTTMILEAEERQKRLHQAVLKDEAAQEENDDEID